MATATKTSSENISSFHLCYLAIISTRSTFTKMANYPGTKLVGEQENEKFSAVRSRSSQNLKCGHFMLFFCRGRQRNVPKCKTHVQSDCFCSLSQLFCGVFATVAISVVVAKLPYTWERRFVQMVRNFPPFHSEWKKRSTSTISERNFWKIALPFDFKQKFPDFLAKW